MEVVRRKGSARNGVVAGSVWESRMKIDEVKGGIKVFNGEETSEKGAGIGEFPVYSGLKQTESGVWVSGRRKTWKSESFDGIQGNPIQMSKIKSEAQGVSDESCEELSVSVDEIEKIPIQTRKKRSKWNTFSDESFEDLEESIDGDDMDPFQMMKRSSEAHEVSDESCEELSVSADEIEKTPIQIRKTRSKWNRFSDESCKDLEVSVDGTDRNPTQVRKTSSEEHKVCEELTVSIDEIEKTPVQVRKARSKWNRSSNEPFKDLEMSKDGIKRNPIQVMKKRSELSNFSDETVKNPGVSLDGIERNPTQIMKKSSESTRLSEETLEDLGVSVDGIERNPIQRRKTRSESKKISDKGTERNRVRTRKTKWTRFSDETCEDLEVPLEGYERKLIQRVKTDYSHKVPDDACKDFGVCKEKKMLSNVGQIKSPQKVVMNENDGDGGGGEDKKKGSFEKEVEKKSFDVKEIKMTEKKPKQVVIEDKRLDTQEKPIPIASNVKKQPHPVIDHPVINPILTKPSPHAVPEEYNIIRESRKRLQNIVDLVMWRDILKTAFVFGFGSFILLSSSFIEDFNFSFISVISYLGLLYLAANSLYRSILWRGSIDKDESDHNSLVKEEEAIWLLKLILPYFNEFLLKLRGLISGDPATTMQVAVLLFVLALCGSSITIWMMAKFCFFGVFTVPRLCSSYSTHLANGKYWVGQVLDACDSWSHKKAVAVAGFTLVWSFSSMVVRIGTVLLLIVAIRYYQQQLMIEDCTETMRREKEIPA